MLCLPIEKAQMIDWRRQQAKRLMVNSFGPETHWIHQAFLDQLGMLNLYGRRSILILHSATVVF